MCVHGTLVKLFCVCMIVYISIKLQGFAPIISYPGTNTIVFPCQFPHMVGCYSKLSRHLKTRREQLMDFELNSENKVIRDTVQRFAREEIRPYVNEWERDEIFPRWIKKQMVNWASWEQHFPKSMVGAR